MEGLINAIIGAIIDVIIRIVLGWVACCTAIYFGLLYLGVGPVLSFILGGIAGSIIWFPTYYLILVARDNKVVKSKKC